MAIARCTAYDPQPLFAKLTEALDAIGGIQQLVSGKTVAIKLNLTGGPRMKLGGLPAHDTYHVHPNFVAATCAALHQAGAKKIVLLESAYDRRSLEQIMSEGGWNIAEINRCGRRQGQLGRHTAQGALEKLQSLQGALGRVHLSSL